MASRSTISTFELFKLFPDQEAARLYLERRRWNGTPVCPHCSCFGKITVRGGKRLGYYRCRDCGEEFTVRTKSIFERSHVPLHKWVYAMVSCCHRPQGHFIPATLQGDRRDAEDSMVHARPPPRCLRR